MWLLKARWSNPLTHLIPYLQDDQKAADSLRPLRWPNGVRCRRCGSAAVESRERGDNGRQRGNWVPGAACLGQPCAMCTAWSRAIFEASQVRPRDWLLVSGLGPWQLHATAMAAAADRQERTAPRCLHRLAGGLYEPSQLAPRRPLAPQGEAEEGDHRAGRPGLPRAGERPARAPRQRGRQRRGGAPAETGRPPRRGVGHRRAKTAPDAPAAPVSRAVREHVRTATITPIIAAQGQGGAQFCPEAYHLDPCTTADYDQRTVNHGA